jgi:hypothetical protein
MSWDMRRDRLTPREKWNPTRYLAKCCNSIIFSHYEGCYASCACGHAFVDETTEYTRLGGVVEELPKSKLEKELE